MKRLPILSVAVLVPLAFGFIPQQGRGADIESLTWEACIREASGNNPDLHAAAESVRQAEAQLKIDRADMYPSLNVEAGGSRYGNVGGSASQSGAAPVSTGTPEDDSSLSVAVSASQLLYDGGKTRSQVKSAAETVHAEERAADVVSVDARFTLRSAFIELLKAQQQVGIAQQIVERRSQNLRLINLRYQAGRENLGSLSKARADEAQATHDLRSAARNLETAQLRLETLLGRRTWTRVKADGSFAVSTPVDRRPDFESIVDSHPSLRELTSRKEASRHSVDVASNLFKPRVSLSSSLGNTAFDHDTLDEEGLDWTVGVTMSIPIYQGGAGRAGVAKARATMRQFDAREKSTWLSLTRILEERWNGMKDSIGKVAVQKQYLDAASERARIAEAQYSSGLLSFNEWIILEDAVVSAKMSYLNAQADMLTAEARWIQAKGGTLEASR